MEDIDIVLLLMERDELGLRALLDKHGGKVNGYLYKRYGNVLSYDEREEALAVATLKVWKAIDSFDEDKGSLSGWFIRITQRCVFDILRREKKFRDHEVELAAASQLKIMSVDLDLDSAPAKKRKKALAAVIDKLPPMQKSIVEADLADEDGKAHSGRLAEILGTTAVSVRVLRKKALGTIRTELAPVIEAQERKGKL